jgi:hypothetical protein
MAGGVLIGWFSKAFPPVTDTYALTSTLTGILADLVVGNLLVHLRHWYDDHVPMVEQDRSPREPPFKGRTPPRIYSIQPLILVAHEPVIGQRKLR